MQTEEEGGRDVSWVTRGAGDLWPDRQSVVSLQSRREDTRTKSPRQTDPYTQGDTARDNMIFTTHGDLA